MKKRVALVLGSGGARGYAHIGVIEEIERRGYDIACIAGCSMGAVVGGIYAAGKLDEYRNWIESLDYLDVLRLVDVSFRYSDETPWIIRNLSLKVTPGNLWLSPATQEAARAPCSSSCSEYWRPRQVRFFSVARTSVSLTLAITDT